MNLVTFGRNSATVTTREAEVPLASFGNGMNLPASNAPGIGICTNVPNPKLSDWTVATQYGVTREPQLTMHLGGNGTTGGTDNHLGDHPVTAVQGNQNPDGSGGTDNNDTLHFIVAQQQAAPGAGFGPAGAEPINRGTETIEVGERAWGTVTVA